MIKQGEVWFARFLDSESFGHEFKNNRPVLVIQSNQQINAANTITVMLLTSNLDNKQPDDIIFKKDTKNGLFCDSVLKVKHIRTFDKSRFLRKMGEIDIKLFEEVKVYLRKHFDI